ncbi:MAG: tetratricopeptide repeat protein [Ignavibacteria bacterium]|jgi:tetratricopeptide (TPR) repeat protein
MRKIVVASLFLAMVFGFAAFQCSSTELTSAKLYIKQEQYDKAKDALQGEIAKNPQSFEAYYLLGYLYGQDGEYDLMLDNFNKSLEISTDFSKDIEDNKLYYWAQSFNKGVSFFNKASKATTQDSVNMFYDKTIQAFNDAIIIHSDSIISYQNLGFAYVNAGKIDDAISVIEKEIAMYLKKYDVQGTTTALDKEKTPGLAEAYAFLGELLTSRGSETKDNEKLSNEYYAKASEQMKLANQYYPNDPDILLHLSNSYIASGKLDEAMSAFKQGVETEPNNKYYRFNYGSMLLNAERYEEAVVQLKKAVEIDPDYENALYNLAVTYVRWGADILDKATEADEEDETYKEKYNAALPYLEKYVNNFDPENGQIWDLLFKVYTNLGMKEKAEDALQKANQYQ